MYKQTLMEGPVFFTHIPKTAGTSIKERVFQYWVEKHDAEVTSCRGYWHLFQSQPRTDFLEGHYAYGVHRLLFGRGNTARYFVMLRDPIDRAISQYHFIRTCNNPWYRYPRLDEVRSQDLVSFYQEPENQNLLTKYVAGFQWELIGRHISLDGRIGQRVLNWAKTHLVDRYEAYGLQERFEASARLFANRLGVKVEEGAKRAKETSDRPAVSDLSAPVRRELRNRNALDVALYRFAKNHFEDQFEETMGRSSMTA